MRNPVNTPASIIFGILVFGFVVMLLSSFLTITKEVYILDQYKTFFVWGNAFLSFTDSLIALHCAGALIAYSFFVAAPTFLERKAFFRSLRSIVISLIVLTAFAVVCTEGLSPLVRRDLRELRASGLFSESLFKKAKQSRDRGESVKALQYLRLSLAIDAHDPEKISEKSLLLSRLNDREFREYLAVTTGEEVREGYNLTTLIERARTAMDAKDYEKAYLYADQVLSVDSSNPEALNIATVAGDQTYRATRSLLEEKKRYVYEKKKQGYAALRSESGRDVVTAYFTFLELRRDFPLDQNVKEYLDEARQRLPSVAFFIRDAELAFSLETIVKKDIVFFNLFTADERELISIGALVTIGGETYFKNIEVAGFIRGNRILYHYTAPYGKLLRVRTKENATEYYINLAGIDREDPAVRSGPRVLAGTPPSIYERGIKLNTTTAGSGYADIDPERLDVYSLSKNDFRDLGIGQLAAALPALSRHAKMDELIVLEILIRLARLFLLLVLTVACLSIGMTQKARYLSSPPKIIYLWVLIIPLVMIQIMEVFLFIHRMSVVFIYFTFGMVLGSVFVLSAHVFFLVFSFVVFANKYGIAAR